MPFLYQTELTGKILQSPQAKRILSYLSPIYGDAYVMLWLIQSIGRVLDRQQELAEDYIRQAFPQTADWSIGLWEAQCMPDLDPEWGLEQRRWAVIAREKPTTPMGPEQLAEIIGNAAGGTVAIQENTGPNTFKVLFLEDGETAALNRRSAFQELNKFKPAHLVYQMELRMKPVVLENRQGFYFSLLTVALWARNRGALALPRLLVGAWVSGPAGTALAFLLRAPVRTAERLSLARLALLFPLTEETRALLEGLRIQAGRACQSDFVQTVLALLLGARGQQAQSLALARMALLFSAVAETRARLDSLRIWAGWVRQSDLTEAALALQSSATNPRRFAMPGFRAGFRERTASRVSQQDVLVRARSGNSQSNTVYMTRTDLRRFNGTHQFNGTRRFNAGIKRSEI